MTMTTMTTTSTQRFALALTLGAALVTGLSACVPPVSYTHLTLPTNREV